MTAFGTARARSVAASAPQPPPLCSLVVSILAWYGVVNDKGGFHSAMALFPSVVHLNSAQREFKSTQQICKMGK